MTASDAPTKRSRNKRKDKTKKPAKEDLPPTLSADNADKYQLYEQAVQAPEAEVEFVERTFKTKRGRKPVTIREDFCGTAFSSCTWVRHRRDTRVFGVDLDPNVLAWARKSNLSWLTPDERDRVTLIEGDVLVDLGIEKVDVLAAMNFSYWYFKTRDALREYFEAARRNLKDDGLFVCDIFGGYEAPQEIEEDRECAGYTYIWDQAYFNPITHDYRCHIHFEFPDGTRLNKAFSYEWRLWSVPEVRELLAEAGFSKSSVYWEGSDDEGEGNGEFTPTNRGEICAGWIAYIVAEP